MLSPRCVGSSTEIPTLTSSVPASISCSSCAGFSAFIASKSILTRAVVATITTAMTIQITYMLLVQNILYKSIFNMLSISCTSRQIKKISLELLACDGYSLHRNSRLRKLHIDECTLV